MKGTRSDILSPKQETKWQRNISHRVRKSVTGIRTHREICVVNSEVQIIGRKENRLIALYVVSQSSIYM